MIWAAIALLIFTAATLTIHGKVWRESPAQVVPEVRQLHAGWSLILRADLEVVVWEVGRNARTLVTRPLEFFNGEACFPGKKTIALGEPMIAMGVLGVVPYLLTGDPILTYNAVLFIMAVIGAMAMFFLVAQWTASSAAGVVAGLLYAFHPIMLRDPVHPYIYDMTWFLFALIFARRLFAYGRWRDALGLAAASSMQMATSFYPFVSATLLALPFTIWLIVRYGFRHVRTQQIAFVIGIMLLAGAFIFSPFIELREAGILATRDFQVFMPLSSYLHGGKQFPNGLCLFLIAVSLVLPRRSSLAALGGDPRWALLAGAALVALAAAGPGGDSFIGSNGIPNIWAIFSKILPGFDTVRVPGSLAIGVHLAGCILAGIGSAGLLRLWRWRMLWAPVICVISITYLDTLRPSVVGLKPRISYEAARIAPAPEAIEFFEVLKDRGNSGPIFEWPIHKVQGEYVWFTTAPYVLLAGYHHRRTSACSASFLGSKQRELERIDAQLPRREAIMALHRLGFTTIVFHHEKELPGIRKVMLEWAREASLPDGMLRLVHTMPGRTAFAIRVPKETSESPLLNKNGASL